MKKIVVVCLAIVSGVLFPLSASFAAECQPQAAQDDFVLPGPNNTCFAFRTVDIGDGDTPYVQKRFLMGDQEEGYKGYPTAVTVGGAFSKTHQSGMKAWFYYLGKYEVTQAQYYAVMGLPDGADPALLQSSRPIADVSYFDAIAFINKLNLWLFANAADALPKRGSVAGFIRLPTEAEWEFAARGGLKVRAEQFTDYYPYEGNLAAYEWFFGPTSSHGKLQEAGKLKPNPLGLHDMLGNVSEMVLTPYQLEYYQGNTGGVTARGGNYTTSEDRIRASLRVEQPLYIMDGKKGFRPGASQTTGFRLALGATVLSDRSVINALQEGWDNYVSSSGGGLPAQLSTAPVEQRANVSIDDARSSLHRIKESVSKAGLPSSVLQDLGNLEAGMDKAAEMRKQADQDVAFNLIRLASHLGFTIGREYFKLGIVDDMLSKMTDNPTASQRMNQRRAEIMQNIAEELDAYHIAMESLISASEAVEKGEAKKYQARLETMDIPGQKWALEVVQKHSAQFRKDKRGNPTAWREDFARIPKELILHGNQ